MTRVQHDVVIRRPIDDVFAFITDPDNDPAWLSSVVDSHPAAKPLRVGSEFTQTVRFLGRRFEVTWRVTEHAPPRRSAIVATRSPMPVGGSFRLEEAAAGTRLTIGVETDAHGFFRLAEPIFGLMAKRELASNAGQLKYLLEAEGARR